MTEYGIWDDEAGGFISTGYYSQSSAAQDIALTLIGQEPIIGGDAEAAEQWAVLEICHEHEEQPADGCEECDSDEDADDDEDED